MTDGHDDRFAVSPQRRGGPTREGPGRRRRLATVAIVGVATIILALGVVGPRLQGRPSFDVSLFATTTTGTSQAPAASGGLVAPGATPLPFLTRAPDSIAKGSVAILGDSFRVLDLGAGTVSAATVANAGTDAVVPAPDGSGWICVCMADAATEDGGQTRRVDLVHIAADGSESSRRSLSTIDGGGDPSDSLAVQTDVDVAPDRRSAILALAQRRHATWAYSVARIDLVDSSMGPFVAIGSQSLANGSAEPHSSPAADSPAPDSPRAHSPGPHASSAGPTPVAPDPSDADSVDPASADSSVQGPLIRRSPDGRVAFVWATIQPTDISDPDEFTTPTTTGWRIDLDAAGSPTGVREVTALAQLPAFCQGAGFAGNDRFVAVCATDPTIQQQRLVAGWSVNEMDADGRPLGSANLPDTAHYYAEPLLDTTNGVVWIWNPGDLRLIRVDPDLVIDEQTLDPSNPVTGRQTPFRTGPATWRDSTSSVRAFRIAPIAGAADGRRLYLLGSAASTSATSVVPPSLGVFVVDATTLAQVGRWPVETAAYSVTPVLGGSAVAVSGLPGLNSDGLAVPWQASMTALDAATGRVLIRFGQLGASVVPIVLPP